MVVRVIIIDTSMLLLVKGWVTYALSTISLSFHMLIDN